MSVISTEKAPKAIGPYSQAISLGDFIFTSGQIPLDPATQQLVQGDIRAQTERVMENLGGASRRVFRKALAVDLVDGGEVVQVGALPKGARVEIELVATRRP